MEHDFLNFVSFWDNLTWHSDHHHLERGWHFYGNTKVGAAGKNNRPVILKFLRYDCCFGVYERIDFQ